MIILVRIYTILTFLREKIPITQYYKIPEFILLSDGIFPLFAICPVTTPGDCLCLNVCCNGGRGAHHIVTDTHYTLLPQWPFSTQRRKYKSLQNFEGFYNLLSFDMIFML